MTYTYRPHGVCSRRIDLEIVDGRIVRVSFLGGCNGNLKGICRLTEGQKIDEVIEKLQGITCKEKPTSCPDQLAQALLSAKKEMLLNK